MTRYTVEYVDAAGEVSETVIRADSEDEAMDIFAARRPDVTVIYEREAT